MTTDAWWLEPDEKLLWSDKPLLFRYLRHRLGAEIWGGPILLCVAILIYYRTSLTGILSSELLSFVALVLAVSILFKPAKVLWERGRTFYALTDRRAVIDVDVHSSSIPLRSLRSIRVRARKDGSGDILLGETLVNSGEDRWISEEGFIAIKNVKEVERLVRDAIEKSAGDQGSPSAP